MPGAAWPVGSPPHALEMTKTVLRAAADAPWDETLQLEEFAEANCFSTQAFGEAAKSILSDSGRGRVQGLRMPDGRSVCH
jgi:enoyl-CoA hydratase/carnithine racemase